MLQDTDLHSTSGDGVSLNQLITTDAESVSPASNFHCAPPCDLRTVSPTFTSAENPFLYPRSLLDIWTVGSAHSPQAAFLNCSLEPESFTTHADANVDEATSKWWLVHTKPRQEKKLAAQLNDLKVPHYLPVTKCKALTRGRTRITRQPQFSGYLFVWCNADQRLRALETNRIVATHFVEDQRGLGRQLWTLADLVEKGVPLRSEERLVAGDSVRVKSGLLRDMTGTVIKRGGKTRLFVFICEWLGGVSVEVEQHLLEPY